MPDLDLSDDYLIFDGEQTVYVTFKRAAGDTTDRVDGALRRAVRIKESGGEWMLSSSEVFWTLGAKELSQAPKEGDVIAEDESGGTAWTIADVEFASLESRYRCRSTKQR